MKIALVFLLVTVVLTHQQFPDLPDGRVWYSPWISPYLRHYMLGDSYNPDMNQNILESRANFRFRGPVQYPSLFYSQVNHYFITYPSVNYRSRVAPLTQRSVDRNYAMLINNVKLQICFTSYNFNTKSPHLLKIYLFYRLCAIQRDNTQNLHNSSC